MNRVKTRTRKQDKSKDVESIRNRIKSGYYERQFVLLALAERLMRKIFK